MNDNHSLPEDAVANDDDVIAILQPKNWPMPRGYANGMSAKGRLVVTGGQIGWDPLTSQFPQGFAAQAHQCLRNICDILEAGGAKPHHLVRLTWYVTDIEAYLAALKDLSVGYRERLGRHYPAMALVQVVRLVEREALVEIEATAVVPE